MMWRPSWIFPSSAFIASVPIPKFAHPRDNLECELRNQRDTSKLYDSSAAFDPEVRKRNCGAVCANLGFAVLARALLHGRFPVLSVEPLRRKLGQIDPVDAARVDVDLIRIRARHVERVHAAMFAKRMLRRSGVELVRRQIILSAE